MSTARQQYLQMYRLARMVKTFTGYEPRVRRAFETHSNRVIWLAFWSLAQRRAFPPIYHWQNARRGVFFRSSRKLREYGVEDGQWGRGVGI